MDEPTQKFFETLLQTQFLAPDAMRASQRLLLERLLRHARAHVPYYRGRGDLDAVFGRNDEIVWDRWHDLPILTREQAQAHAPSLYAEVVPADCGPVTGGQTSGSTGRPLPFRVNGIVAAAASAVFERGLVWAGIPAVRKLAWIRYDYDGSASYPRGARYSTEIRGVSRELHTLSVATDSADQARWLQQISPDVIMGYPNALALVGQALPAELAGHAFRLVICNGEAASDHVRDAIERAFGCPTMNLYSASEIGTIAVEDSTLHRLYVAEEAGLVEGGGAIAPGENGVALRELIVTPFYNYAMPLIRYAPGDFVSFDPTPAPDARTLRRLARIAGRDRNAFILPSGLRWWPTYVVRVMGQYLACDQIQFAQTTTRSIEVRFVSRDNAPIKDADALLAYLRGATPEPMEFALNRVAEIPRRPSGKFEDAVCEIS